MRTTTSTCAFFLLLLLLVPAGGIRAQLPARHLVVATEMTGGTTALIAVDPMTGATSPLGSFPSDNLPPLAVTVDTANEDVIVALDLGGTSRIVRLGLSGLSVVRERILADVPGTCTQLTFAVNGDVHASIDGPSGGVLQVPRNGGPAAQVLAAARVTAMTDFGFRSPVLVLARGGAAGPPAADPELGFYDLGSGQWTLGPFTLTGFTPRGITGIVDLPTAVPRQVLSHPDGTFSVYTMGVASNPAPLPTTPSLPPGGAVALKANGISSFDPIVLGGVAHPFLETFTAFVGPTPAPLTRVAGPFPGDPVDFAAAPDDFATVLPFGLPCGTAMPMRITNSVGSGLPRLGNQNFGLALTDGTPNAFALLAIGLSDQQAGAVSLPATLPNGCVLNVSPDAVLLQTTDSTGRTQVGIPVPNQPGLVGFQLYAQWLQAPALPFATSQPALLQVGL